MCEVLSIGTSRNDRGCYRFVVDVAGFVVGRASPIVCF